MHLCVNHSKRIGETGAQWRLLARCGGLPPVGALDAGAFGGAWAGGGATGLLWLDRVADVAATAAALTPSSNLFSGFERRGGVFFSHPSPCGGFGTGATQAAPQRRPRGTQTTPQRSSSTAGLMRSCHVGLPTTEDYAIRMAESEHLASRLKTHPHSNVYQCASAFAGWWSAFVEGCDNFVTDVA